MTRQEQIEPGARVMANLNGQWTECKVKRRHADGTFDVMPVDSDNEVLDLWQGVTPAELLADDAALWPQVFEAIRGARAGLGWQEAGKVFQGHGHAVEETSLKAYWAAHCMRLFGVENERAAEALVLDRDQAYRFFVSGGYCAHAIANPSLDPSRELFKLYWNEVRMGGRDPAEVDRPVGVAETLEALDLSGAEADEPAARAIAILEEREMVRLPRALEALWTRQGALEAIGASHCNNPEPIPAQEWSLARAEGADGWEDGRLAVRIMTPHQGDHAWWAVFESGGDDGAVYLWFEEDGPPLRRVSRSVPFFFWDLAQTGRAWTLAR